MNTSRLFCNDHVCRMPRSSVTPSLVALLLFSWGALSVASSQSASLLDSDPSWWAQPRLVENHLMDPFDESGEIGMLSIRDVDRDGDGDLIVAGYAANVLVWYENRDLVWKRRFIDDDLQSPRGVFMVDMDGDDDQDAVVTYAGDENVIVWYENELDVSGSGWPTAEITWIRHVIDKSRTLQGLGELHAADMDRDGDMDVVVRGSASNAIVWYEQTEGQWLRHSIDDGPWIQRS